MDEVIGDLLVPADLMHLRRVYPIGKNNSIKHGGCKVQRDYRSEQEGSPFQPLRPQVDELRAVSRSTRRHCTSADSTYPFQLGFCDVFGIALAGYSHWGEAQMRIKLFDRRADIRTEIVRPFPR